MSMSVLLLLLSVQLLRISASDLVWESKDCGNDQIAYSGYSGQELFSINGNLVEKSLFCNSLKFYFINHCSVEEYPGYNLCRLDFPLVDLHLDGERKLLEPLDEAGEEEKDGKSRNSVSIPVQIGIFGPGIFALCCFSICPCFFRKRNPSGHTVLDKDLSSMESESSHHLNSNFEKFPPGSPFRVLASPRHAPQSPRFSMSPKLSRLGSIHLTFNQVVKATNNFSPSTKIGKGAFGIVYKGHLDDGRVIAIKRAKQDQFGGQRQRNQFSREVELLAKIDHQNLVKLLGYIDKGEERLILTEFVPNGNLRAHLEGRRGQTLDFNQRLGIAIDVAHGLTYLHLYSEKQIIHRDVKSSNILLTDSMRAKVADFGFARLGSEDADDVSHVDTVVKGTVGYLDPEYMRSHQLTAKSDVYSFGVLLLEILTGRRPVELKKPIQERVTLTWAFEKVEEGHVGELVDSRMEEVVDPEILMRFFELAISCAAPTRADRPNMKAVGEQLWGIRADYHRRSSRKELPVQMRRERQVQMTRKNTY